MHHFIPQLIECVISELCRTLNDINFHWTICYCSVYEIPVLPFLMYFSIIFSLQFVFLAFGMCYGIWSPDKHWRCVYFLCVHSLMLLSFLLYFTSISIGIFISVHCMWFDICNYQVLLKVSACPFEIIVYAFGMSVVTTGFVMKKRI